MTGALRRTPTALFPPLLGLLGLGLAGRALADRLGLPPWAGEGAVLPGAVLFTVVALAYLAKVAIRPAVLAEDLTPPPLRGSIAAGCMGLMLLAAVLLPLAEPLARGLWWAGLVLHAGAALLLLRVIRARPAPVTPVLFLPFVGQIVAPIAGVPLGYPQLSAALAAGSAIPFCIIAVLALRQFLRQPALPPAARPALMIWLAPLSLSARNAEVLGQHGLAIGLLALAVAVFALLLSRLRWLMQGGWTPGWGAFTFPLAAFVSAQLGVAAPGIALALMLPVAPLILWIVARSLVAWSSGLLHRSTGAATA